MSLEVFVWVVEILVILFCISAVAAMVLHVAELVYRKRTSRIEYEMAKNKKGKSTY